MNQQAQIVTPIHMRGVSVMNKQSAQMNSGGQKIKFVNPNTDNYKSNLEYSAKLHREGMDIYKKNMLPENSTAIVVGSGPSLKSEEALEALRNANKEGYVVFACKQALRHLHDLGIKIDYAVTMDPGAHIARPEKIYKAPGATHIVASSSDPLLFRYLNAGCGFEEWLESLTEDEQKRVLEKDYEEWIDGKYIPPDAGVNVADVILFHSATGYEKEVPMYNDLFSTHECMGGGYNVVNRAVSAALFMGAEKVICVGTDCGWRHEDTFYVDGSDQRPGVDMSDHGMVEGTDADGVPLEGGEGKEVREWMTRPDMLASGVALAKLAKRKPGLIEFVGDTLPAKLVDKDFPFLDKCANFQQ